MNDALWNLFDDLRPGPEADVCPLCPRWNSRLTPSPACRRQTQDSADYRSCPLFLLGERPLDGWRSVPMAYLPALWRGESWLAWSERLQGQWYGGLGLGPTYWIRRANLDAALARISAQETIP